MKEVIKMLFQRRALHHSSSADVVLHELRYVVTVCIPQINTWILPNSDGDKTLHHCRQSKESHRVLNHISEVKEV